MSERNRGVILLVFLMLLESSVVNLPLILWGVWIVSRYVSVRVALWVGVVFGVIVDALLLRQVGIGGLMVVGFIAGLLLVRRMMSGNLMAEAGIFLLAGLVWNWTLGGGQQVFWVVLLAVVGWLWIGNYREKGIRLK